MPNGSGKLVICVDLDGVICTNTYGDYTNAKPITKNISKINKLYEDGYTIIIDSARGTTTGIDWMSVTIDQLQMWGCCFDELYVGQKLYYDLIIDDKSVNPNDKEVWV